LRGDVATDKRSIQKLINQTPEPADGDHNVPGEDNVIILFDRRSGHLGSIFWI